MELLLFLCLLLSVLLLCLLVATLILCLLLSTVMVLQMYKTSLQLNDANANRYHMHNECILELHLLFYALEDNKVVLRIHILNTLKRVVAILEPKHDEVIT